MKSVTSYESAVLYIAALAALMATSYVSFGLFGDYPFTQDEYTYLYQATVFAKGHLYLQAEEQLRPLVEPCMLLVKGHLFSKYPPGFSFVLMFGVLAGIPGLVNPLLSAASCGLIFQMVRMSAGRFAAVCVIALVLSSALFLGYGGSYFSQPLSLFLTALGFFALLRNNILLGGIASGMLILVRPLDGLCLSMMLLAGNLQRRSMLVTAGYTIAGLLALCAFTFMTCGKWSLAAYDVWFNEFRIIDPHANGLWNNITRIISYYVDALEEISWPSLIDDYFPFLGPGFVVSSVAGVLVAPRKISMLCVFYLLLMFTLYTFHPYPGYRLYGDRYWYPTIVPMAILAGYSVRYLIDIRSKASIGIIYSMVVMSQLFFCAGKWADYRDRFAAMKEVQNDIEQQCPPHSIVVLNPLPFRPGGWPAFVNPFTLRRNPFLTGERLFVLNKVDMQPMVNWLQEYTVCNYLYRYRPKVPYAE